MRRLSKTVSKMHQTRRSGVRLVTVVAGLALLAACATPPPADDEDAVAAYEEANDPLEPLNRTLFEINRGLDKVIFRPIAEVYRDVVPSGLRDGVHNAVNNLRTPNIFVNDMLQGEWKRGSESARRFTINSLAGAGGLVDVMAMDTDEGSGPVEFHNEDFGQTLAVWGVGEGPYLVLPILGPSSPRAVVGLVADFFLDPVSYIGNDATRARMSISRLLARGIDVRSRNIDTIDEIERSSIDFYAAVRSLYRQDRAAEISNGAAEAFPSPDTSFDFDDDDEKESKTLVRK